MYRATIDYVLIVAQDIRGVDAVGEGNFRRQASFAVRVVSQDVNVSQLAYGIYSDGINYSKVCFAIVFEANVHETKHVDNKGSYKRGERKWGYQRKHKKQKKSNKIVLKCRSLETGKLKTIHGWDAAAKFAGGHVANIKRAIKTNTNAYGYKWWIYKKVEIRRSVYGVHKDGSVTKVFDTISAAMRSFGEEDRGKGICTSIKWGSRWKGYQWYYADLEGES